MLFAPFLGNSIFHGAAPLAMPAKSLPRPPRRKILRSPMRFQIEHRTTYRYAGTASESFMEARLTPVSDTRQRLLQRTLRTSPACNIHRYVDYYGNSVETFSIIQRHTELTLISHSEVETTDCAPPRAALDITVSEARQIFRSERLPLYEYLMPSPAIPMSAEVHQLANEFFRPGHALGPALLTLNHWIHQHLRYTPGATRIDTPITTVLREKTGVCQDFAQLMIAILRSAEIPARYVTGYIETEDQRQASAGQSALIGASESHAWIEVFLPGGFWYPLDPTNHCLAGERHVKTAVGRDYHDSTPTRGVFKGTHTELLSTAVHMHRLADTLASPTPER